MSKKIKDQLVGLDPHFRYRGLNHSRIETFSDAVFALAVTLVILSSSVPSSFLELRKSMNDILPFLFSVILIALIWVQHYIFFLRYGLQNTSTMLLNTLLLFLVLTYVYPLKFLMKFLVTFYPSLFTGDFSALQSTYFSQMLPGDMRYLMTIYGLGAASIFFTMALLYRQALTLKSALNLSEYELFHTKGSMLTNILLGAIPLSSVVLVWLIKHEGVAAGIAGFSYFLYTIIMPIYGWQYDKRLKVRFPELTQAK